MDISEAFNPRSEFWGRMVSPAAVVVRKGSEGDTTMSQPTGAQADPVHSLSSADGRLS